MIRNIIETNLPKLAGKKGAVELGDRSAYIGASDIGQCPRKAIMSKLFPQPITLEQQIVFERGHLAEDIVHESLLEHCREEKNKSVNAQYEVTLPGNPNIKAHIDFVLTDVVEQKRTVVEVKTASMVTTPYDSWINQCIFQQGLLLMENPDISVDGYVLVIDLKTGAIAEFKVEFDEVVFSELVAKAEWLLGQLTNSQDIDYDGLPLYQSILCGYCGVKDTCPAYADKGKLPDDLKDLIVRYAEINGQIKPLEKELSPLKETIKAYGPFRATIDGIKASYTVNKMMSLDIKALKENEPDLYNMYSVEKETDRLNIG